MMFVSLFNNLMLSSCDTVRFDGNSELVAELVTANGFKSAYAIKDGAEGPRGWQVCAAAATFFCTRILRY